MTDDEITRRYLEEVRDPATLAAMVPRSRAETISAPDPAPAPGQANPWPHDMPPPPRGGSDPTTPPLELDPEKLAAQVPRSS